MRLREDAIRYRDGTESVFAVVERRDFVVIVARRGEARLLVRQYRHPIEQWTLELPQGAREDGETWLDAARRELREETGWTAGAGVELGTLYEAAGFATHAAMVVRLEVEAYAGQTLDRGELGMGCQFAAPAELRAMIRAGAIQDAPTLAALLMETMEPG
jgi:ADP-ribose pyrophosphatase